MLATNLDTCPNVLFMTHYVLYRFCKILSDFVVSKCNVNVPFVVITKMLVNKNCRMMSLYVFAQVRKCLLLVD